MDLARVSGSPWIQKAPRDGLLSTRVVDVLSGLAGLVLLSCSDPLVPASEPERSPRGAVLPEGGWTGAWQALRVRHKKRAGKTAFKGEPR